MPNWGVNRHGVQWGLGHCDTPSWKPVALEQAGIGVAVELGVADPAGRPAPGRGGWSGLSRRSTTTSHNEVVDLVPDVDYAAVAASLAGPVGLEELGSHLSRAWAEAYRSRLPLSSLLELDSDGARFLFDLTSAAGAERADRTVAAWGRSRPVPRPRDQSYQRGVSLTHKAAPTDPSIRGTWWLMPPAAPSDRTCFRRIASSTGDGLWRDVATVRWSGRSPTGQGRSSSAACCTPTTATSRLWSSLGVLRDDGLQIERFRNRFDL